MKSVREYAIEQNVSERTVYDWIQKGKIKAEKVDGKLHIISENSQQNFGDNSQSQVIEMLKSENEYLRQELSKANETIADMQNRHDTIVLSLSNQLSEEKKRLEDKTSQLTEKKKLIEEMRNRTFWRRIKMALGSWT